MHNFAAEDCQLLFIRVVSRVWYLTCFTEGFWQKIYVGERETVRVKQICTMS